MDPFHKEGKKNKSYRIERESECERENE